MNRIIAGIMVLLIAVAMSLCVAGCMDLPESNNDANTTDVPPATEESDQSVVDANNRFAFDLYRNIAADEDGNIFFSPFSISSAMAVTHEGARGETAEEIQSVFHFPVDENAMREGFLEINEGINARDSEYSLKVINALWAEKSYPFLPEYIETASRYYSAETTNLDFINSPEDSASIINNWVEEMTEGRISNLIQAEEIDDITAFVITNAIYFKATWVNQFDEYFTHEADFWITPEKSVKVQMMESTDFYARFRYTETDDMQVLGMPYKHESDKQLSMIVILPKNNDLSSVENTLDARTLDELRAEMVSKKVDVSMPKFRLETDYLLSDSLKEMGIPTAFSEETADFSGMDGTRNLFIRDVIHKTFVEVYEEGTEAAAATRILEVAAAREEQPPAFVADHPFIFLIQDDETGNILFMGRVTDPSGLLPPPSPLDSMEWKFETVDNGYTEDRHSLALDINGNPHICYINSSIKGLKYAIHDDNIWKIETVNSEDEVRYMPSLLLDKNENPHICYFNDKNEELKYAVYDGRTWNTETVDNCRGYSTSLALDNNGNPHICYFNRTDKDLKYAVYDGNTWKIETVESIEDEMHIPLPSLALDNNGNPHICYRGEDEVLKYAAYDGKSWKIEIVDSGGRIGYHPSLALDNNGNPHICYSYYHDKLKYAVYNGESWDVETVDGRGGSVPSLALNSNDKPHICYHGVHGELIYAAHDGKSWNTVTVGKGNYPSLVLDNNGNPHISYYYLSNRHLMYASGAGDKMRYSGEVVG